MFRKSVVVGGPTLSSHTNLKRDSDEKTLSPSGAVALATFTAGAALAEPVVPPLIYGVQGRNSLNDRFGENDEELLVLDFDASRQWTN